MAQYQPPPLLIDIKNLTAKYLADSIQNFAQWFNDHDSGLRRWTTVDFTSLLRGGNAAQVILQSVQSSTVTAFSTTSGTFSATNLSQSFTPKSSSSTIRIRATSFLTVANGTATAFATLAKDGTNLLGSSGGAEFTHREAGSHEVPVALQWQEASGSTTARTYAVYIRNGDATTSVSFGGSASTQVLLIEEIL